jgi:hypothetical protein
MARQPELCQKIMLLTRPHGNAGQFWLEKIQPDFAHRNQARIVSVLRQAGVELTQIVVAGPIDVQGVDAEGVTVATRMGQSAYGIKVAHFNRRQHAMHYMIDSCISPEFMA